MSVADYNTDPDSNTSISGINIAEGCPPSGINNAIRQMMADIKDKADSTDTAITTLDANVVKLSGDQNVGGKKTFSSTVKVSGTGAIGFKVDNTTAPRSVDIRAQDNGNAGIWDMENNRWMIHANNGGVTDVPIGLTTAAPADSDSSTRVPTTAWVGSNAVMLAGDQNNVGGVKTFTASPQIKRVNPYLDLIETDWEKGGTVTATQYMGVRYYDKNSSLGGAIYYHYYDTKSGVLEFRINDVSTASATGAASLYVGYPNTGIPNVRPDPTNKVILGTQNYKWKEIWCNQSSINTSSDERIKQQIADIPDAVLDAWGDVDWIQFKYNDSVAEKGADKARLHNGLIAQRVDAAFKAHGLDASRYGLFLYDTWEAEPEEKDEDGKVTREARPAGDAYGLRYTEALAMEAAYQRRRADRAEARIADLERKMEAVLASIGGQA